MRRRPRQISLKECYDILHLEKGADLQAVKHAYRKRAFELHPDLNPNDAEASQQFQLLNEAYVALTAMLKPAEEARRRAEAKKGAAEKGAESAKAQQKAEEKATEPGPESRRAYAEQDVLRDLLNDPFARRVFEDIYSELNRKQTGQQASRQAAASAQAGQERPKPENTQRKAPLWEETTRMRVSPPQQPTNEKGVTGVVKDWLRRQIDEEQTLLLPAAGLAPGRKIRLKVRRGISDDVSAVEVTLPPDFAVGKAMRLRGLGKRVGPWQGDLYLTINTR